MKKNIILITGVILGVIGFTYTIAAYLKENLTASIIASVFVAIGIILFAIGFGE